MSNGLSRALALVRAQRHSQMNHLQVVSGWLQLGRPERALHYIQQVSAQMDAEGAALRRIDAPEVGLFVVEMGLLAEPRGVILGWRVTGPVDPAALPAARAQVTAALDEVSRLPDGERRLCVTLGSTVSVHRPTARGEG